MKSQIKKKSNIIVLIVFTVLGIVITTILYKMVQAHVTRDSIFLVSFIFGTSYFLAVFGWIQDMRTDSRIEKQRYTPGEEHY